MHYDSKIFIQKTIAQDRFTAKFYFQLIWIRVLWHCLSHGMIPSGERMLYICSVLGKSLQKSQIFKSETIWIGQTVIKILHLLAENFNVLIYLQKNDLKVWKMTKMKKQNF